MDEKRNKKNKKENDLRKLVLEIKLKISKDTGHDGDLACGTSSESKQQYSDGSPSSTRTDIADHEAVSHDLKQRKQTKVSSCRICGRKFQSMKSLYGHMRSHTRNWRGVSPPEENTPVPITAAQSLSLPATATDFNTSNQVLTPIKWPVTAKRGRKVKAAINPSYEKESKDPSINAAYTLMLLANGRFSPVSTLTRQQQNRNTSPYDSRVGNNEGDLKTSSQPNSMDANSTSMDVDKTEVSNQNINGSLIGYNRTVDMPSNQSAICKPAVADLASNQKQYFCNMCDKSFSSHQALGGHTASHYNKSRTNSGAGILEAQAEGLPMKVSGHRCNICGLIFPTGQALGGHKRKHWPGPENSVAPSSETTTKPSHLNIDLNLPAQPDAE